MQMNLRSSVLWITRTAVMTALLVTVQFLTASLGTQYVTGSAVNLLLAVSALIFGPTTGFTVAVISPLCAFLVGVGPAFPPLIPFISLGNFIFILVWFFLGLPGKGNLSRTVKRSVYVITPIAAAVAKSLALYAGVVLLAVPYILELNEKQSEMFSLMFSYPQLVTALIGGSLAAAAAPTLKKALKSGVQ